MKILFQETLQSVGLLLGITYDMVHVVIIILLYREIFNRIFFISFCLFSFLPFASIFSPQFEFFLEGQKDHGVLC